MKTCKICGRSFDDENCEGVVVNEGTDNEYFVCEDVFRMNATMGILFPAKIVVRILLLIGCTMSISGALLLPNVRPVGKM